MDRAKFPGILLNNGRYKIAGIDDYFISNATYGEVFKAFDTETGETVALKRIIQYKIKNETDRKYLAREIKIMVMVTRNV